MEIKERNVVLAIVFTIITCGIYGLYWLVQINNDLNKLSDEPNPQSGALVIILTIVTCGIYGWYFWFKAGEKVDKINGVEGGNTKVIYIVLAILELSVVNYILAQLEINKHATIKAA